MKRCTLLFCLALLHLPTVWGAGEVIRLLGAYPFDGPIGNISAQMEPAVRIAVQTINNNPNFLPDQTLELSAINTRCNSAYALQGVLGLLENEECNGTIEFHALIGAACSGVSDPLSHILNYWEIPIVSYGSTEPELTQKGTKFMRTVPNDQKQATVWAALVELYDWKHFGTLVSSGADVHLNLERSFRDALSKDVTVARTENFLPTASDHQAQIREALQTFQDDGIKIIFLACYKEDAQLVIKEWVDLGFHATGNALIGTDSWVNPADPFWLDAVTGEPVPELVSAREGIIAPNPVSGFSGNQEYIDFLDAYKADTGQTNVNPFISYAYDAVLVVANSVEVALTKTAKRGTARLGTEFRAALREEMFTHSFVEGLTGTFKFNGTGDRTGSYSILNIQSDGEFVEAVIFDGDALKFDRDPTLIWPGGVTSPPEGEIPSSSDDNTAIIVGGTLGGFFFLCLITLLLLIIALLIALYVKKNEGVKLVTPNFTKIAFGDNVSTAVVQVAPPGFPKMLKDLYFSALVIDILRPHENPNEEKAFAYYFTHTKRMEKLLAIVMKGEVKQYSRLSKKRRKGVFVNSEFAALFANYARIIGAQYIFNCFGFMVQEIDYENKKEKKKKENSEIRTEPGKKDAFGTAFTDPTKDLTHLLADNIGKLRLQVASQKVIQTLSENMRNIPAPLISVFKKVQSVMEERYKLDEKEITKALGLIFLVHFICVALRNPLSFGLMHRRPTKRTQQILYMISEVLENLARGSKFAGDDMERLNGFLDDNAPAVHGLLRDLPKGKGQVTNLQVPASVKVRSINILYNFVQDNNHVLATKLERHANREDSPSASTLKLFDELFNEKADTTTFGTSDSNRPASGLSDNEGDSWGDDPESSSTDSSD